MDTMTSRQTTTLLVLGASWIVAGLLANEWFIGHLLSDDGTIDSASQKIALRCFQAAAVLWGFVSVTGRRHPLILKFNLLFVCLLVAAPWLAELSLRAGIVLGTPAMRNPDLYYDSHDDNHWKLVHSWQKAKLFGPEGTWQEAAAYIHPSLGWSQAVIRPDNPLGLQEGTLRALTSDGRRKILFYGDSFVKGAARPDHFIPTLLEQRLPDTDVVDLGVGGYGTDQMLLLFDLTHRSVTSWAVVVGVYTDDVGRAVLSVRSAKKPHFDIGPDGELVLRGVPIEKNQQAFFEEHAPSPASYLLAMLMRRLQISTAAADRTRMKRMINEKIIQTIKDACEQENTPLLYVLFYDKSDLQKTRWEERFMKQTLDKLAVPYADTKPFIKEYCTTNSIPFSSLYAPDGHHNDLGNEVVSDCIWQPLEDMLRP